MEKNTWDNQKQEHVVTPQEMSNFLSEIEEVCKKHGLSISHEDYHGSFQVMEYDEKYISWLKRAEKDYVKPNKEG